MAARVEDIISELRAARRLVARVGAVALLVFGTFTALTSKFAYDVRAHGLVSSESIGGARGTEDEDRRRAFEKPLFMTLLSFVAMACCIVCRGTRDASRPAPRERSVRIRENHPSAAGRGRGGERGGDGVVSASGRVAGSDRRGGRPTDATRGGGITELLLPPPERYDDVAEDAEEATAGPSHHLHLPVALIHLVPITLADLLATALMSFGLLHVSISTFLMLRHAQLMFAAFMAIVLRRALNDLHRLAIALSFSGVALVMLSAILSEPQVRVKTLEGMGYVVASQAVQAAQLTFEGYFLKQLTPCGMSPMAMIGAEGIFGVVLMVAVVLPIAQGVAPGSDPGGCAENTLDSLAMVASTPRLLVLLVLYVCGLVAHNFIGMNISHAVGVASRSALETIRTLLCWGAALLLHYAKEWDVDGETLTRFSALQLGGFAIASLGTLLYGRGDAADRKRVFERQVARINRGPARSHERSGVRRGRHSAPPTQAAAGRGRGDFGLVGDAREGEGGNGSEAVEPAAIGSRGVPIRDAEGGSVASGELLPLGFTDGSLKASMSFSSYSGVLSTASPSSPSYAYHSSIHASPRAAVTSSTSARASEPGQSVAGFNIREGWGDGSHTG